MVNVQRGLEGNVKAMVIVNSKAIGSVVEFTQSQFEMNKPVLIFMDGETNETIDYFWLEAESMKELELMQEQKIFFTSSIPEDTKLNKYGALFVGYPKGYFQSEEYLEA